MTAIDITGLAYGGRGIGRLGNKVVFVPFTAPGDKAVIKIINEKKGYAEARLVEVASPSSARVAPRCVYFGECGGCAWQHIEYSEQVAWKQKILEETIERLGRIKEIEFDAPVPSPEQYFYRRRARFQLKGRSWGFFGHSTHKIIDINSCPVLERPLEKAFVAVKSFILGENAKIQSELPLYSVELALSSDGRVTAVFHCFKAPHFTWERLLEEVDCIKGVEVRVDPLKTCAGRVIKSLGDTQIAYETCGIKLRTHGASFTQANTGLNSALVNKAIELAGLKPGDRVVDLFAGCGNITLTAAKVAGSAIGVEFDRAAVESARQNALLSGLPFVKFVRADSAVWLKALEKKSVDVVILDPPRGGDMETAKALACLRPSRIAYVSCSPPTLARDISELVASGYGNVRAVLFDMFPQTFHIEAVVALCV
ncbi:23S rRNA (uracil(1939)-C(5))-methyltransferase RlmD [bacterium]|nr:MAG: 23S rRNA (uracil(1939)-C(5))-methyltransferase RlmD [bacterium]